jgi:hypothetical protein
MHGTDDLLLRQYGGDLAAQVLYMGIYRAVIPLEIIPLDPAYQLHAGKNPVGIFHHEPEQIELDRSQFHFLAMDRHPMGLRVELYGAGLESLFLLLRLNSSP